MTSVPMRRTLLALATTAALVPTAPALAQTAPPTTPTPVAAPVPTQPSLPYIEVGPKVIEHGGTHVVAAFAPVGQIGQTVQLWANTLPNRTPRLIREAVLVETEQDAVAIAVWDLHPGGTTTYYVVADGVRSAAQTVRVRRTVTIGVRQADGVYTFSGQIARSVAGVQVTVARLDPTTRRVTGVASTRTTTAGRYTIRTGLPQGLAGYYALTEAADGLDAGRSRLYGLLVNTRPAS